MRILVGIPCGDTLVVPFHNTFGQALRGDYKIEVTTVNGMNTVSARNKIVRKALDGKFDYIFFMDSDMSFPPNTLDNLIKRDKDIVGGFYMRKKGGYLPNAFMLGSVDGDKFLTQFVTELTEVEAVGTGCMLIKTEVFKNIEMPWFEYWTNSSPEGHVMTEDIVFCEKAKSAGYKIFCDGEIRCGHVGMFIVTPIVKDGRQEVVIDPV